MNANAKAIVLSFLCVVAVGAQQPNIAGQHYMTINGVDGPPFPIVNNPVRTALPAAFTIWGAANQPYAIFQGNLQTGSTIIVNSIVDLALSPFPVVAVDGFVNSFFNTGPSGIGGFNVTVPPTGTPPNGSPDRPSALVAVPDGRSVQPAFRRRADRGDEDHDRSGPDHPVLQPRRRLEHDDHARLLRSRSTAPTTAPTICARTGSSPSVRLIRRPTTRRPTCEMNSGPPRFATFWCDLVCGANQVKITTDTNPGVGLPKWTRVDFMNVADAYFSPAVTHNFGMLMRDDGYLELIFSSNNASQFDQITGIGPGQRRRHAAPVQLRRPASHPLGRRPDPAERDARQRQPGVLRVVRHPRACPTTATPI